MITLGEKQVIEAHGFHIERTVVLKNGAPVLLPVDSFVASHFDILIRKPFQMNMDIERAKLVVHDEKVLAILREVDAEMYNCFGNSLNYGRLLSRDNYLITKVKHMALKNSERLFVELFSTDFTIKLRLRKQDVSTYVEKYFLAQHLPIFPELNELISGVTFRLFWS